MAYKFYVYDNIRLQPVPDLLDFTPPKKSLLSKIPSLSYTSINSPSSVNLINVDERASMSETNISNISLNKFLASSYWSYYQCAKRRLNHYFERSQFPGEFLSFDDGKATELNSEYNSPSSHFFTPKHVRGHTDIGKNKQKNFTYHPQYQVYILDIGTQTDRPSKAPDKSAFLNSFAPYRCESEKSTKAPLAVISSSNYTHEYKNQHNIRNTRKILTNNVKRRSNLNENGFKASEYIFCVNNFTTNSWKHQINMSRNSTKDIGDPRPKNNLKNHKGNTPDILKVDVYTQYGSLAIDVSTGTAGRCAESIQRVCSIQTNLIDFGQEIDIQTERIPKFTDNLNNIISTSVEINRIIDEKLEKLANKNKVSESFPDHVTPAENFLQERPVIGNTSIESGQSGVYPKSQPVECFRCFNFQLGGLRRGTQTCDITKLKDCYTQHHICCGIKKIQTEPERGITTKNVAVGIALAATMKGTNTYRRSVSPSPQRTNKSNERRSLNPTVSTQTKAYPISHTKYVGTKLSIASKETQYLVPDSPASNPQPRNNSPTRRGVCITKISGSRVKFESITKGKQFSNEKIENGDENNTHSPKISPNNSPKMNSRKNRNIFTSKDTKLKIIQSNDTMKVNPENCKQYSSTKLKQNLQGLTKIKKKIESETKFNKVKRLSGKKDLLIKGKSVTKQKRAVHRTDQKKLPKKMGKSHPVPSVDRRYDGIMSYQVSPIEKRGKIAEMFNCPLALNMQSNDKFSNVNIGLKSEEDSEDNDFDLCLCSLDDLKVYQVTENEDIICVCPALERIKCCAVENYDQCQCCCCTQDEYGIPNSGIPDNPDSSLPKEKDETLKCQRDSLKPKRQQSDQNMENDFGIDHQTNGIHYRGDNCSLEDPLQREKEIRRLLGIGEITTVPNQEQQKQRQTNHGQKKQEQTNRGLQKHGQVIQGLQVKIPLSQGQQDLGQLNQNLPRLAQVNQRRPQSQEEENQRQKKQRQLIQTPNGKAEEVKTVNIYSNSKENGNRKSSTANLVPSSILTAICKEENMETRSNNQTAVKENLKQSNHSYVEMVSAGSPRILPKDETFLENLTTSFVSLPNFTKNANTLIETTLFSTIEPQIVLIKQEIDEPQFKKNVSRLKVRKSDEIELNSTDYVVFETVLCEGQTFLPSYNTMRNFEENQHVEKSLSVNCEEHYKEESQTAYPVNSVSEENLKKVECSKTHLVSPSITKVLQYPEQEELPLENVVFITNPIIATCAVTPKSPELGIKSMTLSKESHRSKSSSNTINTSENVELVASDKDETDTSLLSVSFAVVYENMSNEFISTSSITANECEQPNIISEINDENMSDLKSLVLDQQFAFNYSNKDKHLKKESPFNIPTIPPKVGFDVIIKSENMDQTKPNYFHNEIMPKSVSFDPNKSNDKTNIFQFTSTKNLMDLNKFSKNSELPSNEAKLISDNSQGGTTGNQKKYDFSAIKASFEKVPPQTRNKNRNLKSVQKSTLEDHSKVNAKDKTETMGISQNKQKTNKTRKDDINPMNNVKTKYNYDYDVDNINKYDKELLELKYSQRSLSIVDEESKSSFSVNSKSTTLNSLRSIPKYHETKIRNNAKLKKFDALKTSKEKLSDDIKLSASEISITDNSDSDIESTTSGEVKSTSSAAIHSPTASATSSLDHLDESENVGKILESKSVKKSLPKSPIKFFRKLKSILTKKAER